jgi:integrase
MREAQRREGSSNSRSPRPTAGSVAAFLERWLEGVVRRTLRERTWYGYRAIVASVPASVGSVDLASPELAHELQLWLNGLTLHPRTVAHRAACLRAAFTYARRRKLIDTNPAADLDLPAIPRTNRIPLTAAQLRKFLAFTGRANALESRPDDLLEKRANDSLADPLHPLWVTAAWTGLRQGELLALRWQDVNLDRGSLVVRGSLTRLPGPNGTRYVITEPKTPKSVRTVPLLPAVVDVLRDLRKAQLERPGKLDQGLVFCTEAGSPLDAAKVTKRYQAALAAAGLPRARFHDIRHLAATMWIEHGMDLATVADLLGHSTISTTVNVYGHLSDRHRAEAMRKFGEAMG